MSSTRVFSSDAQRLCGGEIVTLPQTWGYSKACSPPASKIARTASDFAGLRHSFQSTVLFGMTYVVLGHAAVA